MNDMTEQECRAAWEKHQKNAHEDDMMSYMEFRSNCGLRDEEEIEEITNIIGSRVLPLLHKVCEWGIGKEIPTE